MILLQADLPIEAGKTILNQWGVPGAIIIFLVLAIIVATKWLASREDKRREYEKIEKENFRKRHDKLQDKYENQIIIQTQNTEKVIGVTEDLKDVVVNNTVAFKEFSKFLNKENE